VESGKTTYDFELNKKKYHITVNNENQAVSASLISRPDSLWGKIKLAVCNFFRISTNKRLVGSFNMLESEQKKQAKAGTKEALTIKKTYSATKILGPLSGKGTIEGVANFASNLQIPESNDKIRGEIIKFKEFITYHADSGGCKLEIKGNELIITKPTNVFKQKKNENKINTVGDMIRVMAYAGIQQRQQE